MKSQSLPERLYAVAGYARSYANSCEVPNWRAYARPKPGLSWPPQVRELLKEHVDLKIDGHITVILREVAILMEEAAKALDTNLEQE